MAKESELSQVLYETYRRERRIKTQFNQLTGMEREVWLRVARVCIEWLEEWSGEEPDDSANLTERDR